MAGLHCGGYEKAFIFVHGTASPNIQDHDGCSRQSQVQQYPWLGRYGRRADRGTEVRLWDPLLRTAREQLYVGYLWNILQPKSHRSAGTNDQPQWGWTSLVSQLYDAEPSLRYIVLATALGCLASDAKNGRQMHTQSLQTYNLAVKEIGKSLKERDAHKRDGLIVAAALMASFEVRTVIFVPGHCSHIIHKLMFVADDEPATLAWTGHSCGQLAMFLARGPEALTTGTSHHLFVDSRINMVCSEDHLGDASVTDCGCHGRQC